MLGPRSKRLVHKLEAFTEHNRKVQQKVLQQKVRDLIWRLYRALGVYRLAPSSRRKTQLWGRFDRIFKRETGFATLDRLLKRLHANKAELLRVLDRPEIPLHTNGSENDIRCQVTKRKVSGGTRSDDGRDCRDAFLGLKKTCAKLKIAFWDYLGAKLGAVNQPGVLASPKSSNSAAPRPDRPRFCQCYISPCDRGRDGDCSPPPARTRTGGIPASGSYLECLTAKRTLGRMLHS